MKLRNIAIIAHVDHGKTTLVDRLLQQSGVFRENQRVADRVMDSNDLERERGITILAKATSVVWKDVRINIVDTPGHADFGGEVERILSMVDGAIVLVDAAEGPMPQTKFVVGKALKIGLRPIVCVNKVDKPDARPNEVINEVFDLFAALDATDEQLDFPIIYGSAKLGWMSDDADNSTLDMAALFDLVLRHVPEPKIETGGFRMLGTLLEANPYLGRIITGRVFSGSVKPNQTVKVLDRTGKVVEQGRVSKISCLSRHRANTHRRGGGWRYCRHRRPGAVQCCRYPLRARCDQTAAGSADRSADIVHDVSGQRFAAGRNRKETRSPAGLFVTVCTGKRKAMWRCGSSRRRTRTPISCPAVANCSLPF